MVLVILVGTVSTVGSGYKNLVVYVITDRGFKIKRRQRSRRLNIISYVPMYSRILKKYHAEAAFQFAFCYRPQYQSLPVPLLPDSNTPTPSVHEKKKTKNLIL